MSTLVEPPEKDEVKKFLPPYRPQYPLDPAYGPVTKAQHIAPSLIGPELRKIIDNSTAKSRDVIKRAWKTYSKLSGSEYPAFIERLGMDDAEIALVTMGAYAKDVMYVARKLKREGVKAGVVRLRYFRPFPHEELTETLKNAKAVGVVDFSYAYGSPNSSSVLFNDVRSTLYEGDSRPALMDFMFVGGREPSVEHFEQAFRLLQKRANRVPSEKQVVWPTLRGEDS
jgi:pyruvate ferredoxin oxidoreductase alpha subunit